MRRLEVVGLVQERFDVSQRRKCLALCQSRTTERYVPKANVEGRRIAERVVKLAGENPRYGYQRVAALLKREGIRANLKPLYRIWRPKG